MRIRLYIKILLCITFSQLLKAQEIIQMEKLYGVQVMSCEVNGLPLKFILDTGASNVSISISEALFMLKNGYLKEEDLIGTEYYTLANGTIESGTQIILKELKIGSSTLRNITASIIHNMDAPLLLGQSALNQLGRVEIDFDNNQLIIGGIKKGIESTAANNITNFEKSLKEKLYQFDSFSEDWSKWHLTEIENVEIIAIPFKHKDQLDYLLLCEIHPKLIEEQYYDAHVGYNKLLWVKYENGSFRIKNQVNGFFENNYQRFKNKYAITDVNKDGIEEIHIEAYTATSSPSTRRDIYVLDCSNNTINTIWTNNSFNCAELKDGDYIFYNWIWGDTDNGRYSDKKWDVRIFGFNGNSYSLQDSIRTKQSYDNFQPNYKEIQNDAFEQMNNK